MNGINEKSHRDKKNPASAENFRKEKKARNALRGKQKWVPSSFQQVCFGTLEELDKLSDAEVSAIVPAHWERS
jgi:hypothetical protein